MAPLEFGAGFVWLLIVALAVGCFALRLSFIQLHGWVIEFPPGVERALVYVPPAILAALVFPQLFVLDGSVVTAVVNERAIAGGVAAIVAWRTGSMLATIGVGMGVLWGFRLLLG
ncbi:AzlD domain-containing protein [Natronorarus salvus]|uniref:AzlD domain-containing protein n=1 Tax=Natronorarus salvus TaxID=3117733 RepID=UPI002F26D98C